MSEHNEHARGVVATWLEHLAIGECLLVCFSTDVSVFPEDGTFLEVRGTAGAANRKRLLDAIEQTKPQDRTNTLLALETAYRYPNLDTVILFTDGEPNSPTGGSNQFDSEIAERIHALCGKHGDIPVNTVGLGDYFKPKLSEFLIRVARETGGSFLGR
ncbi:MAG: vWA domain-containing protein [Planctomycetota bacterium]